MARLTKQLAALEDRIGHRFTDQSLLVEAFIHPSATRHGRISRRSNQRLEFLGDRVLNLIIADLLMRRFPDEDEGALSRRHAALVRRETLAAVALPLELGKCLTIARGEEEAGGRTNPSILADAMEALIGAFYLDAGLEACARLVREHWEPLIGVMVQPPRDAKTALQEWTQARGMGLPNYVLTKAEGPAHAPSFEVAVQIEGYPPQKATAGSKRAAEQSGAMAMLERLTREKDIQER